MGNRVRFFFGRFLSALLIVSMALPTHFAQALRPTGAEESAPIKQQLLEQLRGTSAGQEENGYRISVDTGVSGLMRPDNRAGYLADFRKRISEDDGLLWDLDLKEWQPAASSEEKERVMTVGAPGSAAGPVYGFVRYRIVRPFADDPSRMAILIEDLGVDPAHKDQLTELALVNLVKANVTLWRPVVLARVPLVSSQSRILREAGFVAHGQEDAEENILLAYGDLKWTSKPINLESVASESSIDLLPMAGYAIQGDVPSEQVPNSSEWSWSGVAQTQWPQLLNILNEGRPEGQAAFTYEDLVYLQSDRQVSSMVLYPREDPSTIAGVIFYNHEGDTHRIIAFGVGQNFRGQGLGQYLLGLFKDQVLTETRPNADVLVRLDGEFRVPRFFKVAGFRTSPPSFVADAFEDTGADRVSMWTQRVDPGFLQAMTRAGFTSAGQEEKYTDPLAALNSLMAGDQLPESFEQSMRDLWITSRLVDANGKVLDKDGWLSFDFLARAADRFRNVVGGESIRTPADYRAQLDRWIPVPTESLDESGALRLLLQRGKPAGVSWNEMAYLASVAYPEYAALNPQSFYQGGSSLDHYFGEGENQTLELLQSAIPELSAGTDEAGALRLLLERGKPDGVKWFEMAVVASVAYPEYAALNQQSFYRIGSALDHYFGARAEQSLVVLRSAFSELPAGTDEPGALRLLLDRPKPAGVSWNEIAMVVSVAYSSYAALNQQSFSRAGSAVDHYFGARAEQSLAGLRSAIPELPVGTDESGALWLLLDRPKPAGVSWNEIAYLASVAYPEYAGLNQQSFLRGGSALDHYFGESAQQTLAGLRSAIPELPAGTDESGALRLLLARGKPAEVKWFEMAYLASVAYPGYAALSQQPFLRGGNALDHYFGESAQQTLAGLQSAIPELPVGTNNLGALRLLLARGKPAGVKWFEMAYLASVAYAEYAALDQQAFGRGGSALDHYFGESAEQSLAGLRSAIPELPAGTDELGALRLLLARGKPAGVKWFELAIVASVAYPEYAALDQQAFHRGGSTLDHLGEPPTLTGQSLTNAIAYSNRWARTLRELANNRYPPFGSESVERPTLDSLAALFFDLALTDQLPKSPGPGRIGPDGSAFLGLAPGTFRNYLPVLGHRLFVPWLLEVEAQRIGNNVHSFAQRPVFVFGPDHAAEGIQVAELLSQVSSHADAVQGTILLVGAAAQKWKAEQHDQLHPSILGVTDDFGTAVDLLNDVSPGSIYLVGSAKQLQGLRAVAGERGIVASIEPIASESLANILAGILKILGGLPLSSQNSDLEQQYGVPIEDLARQLKALIQIGV